MLAESVHIIGGGGRGIGKAAAVELGRYGATVVVNDLGTSVHGGGESDEPAQSALDAVVSAGGDGMVHHGDLTSLEYTSTLVDDVLETYGRIDGVANFAGILRDALSYKMTEDEWDQVITVHLRSHFSLLRTVAGHWVERGSTSGLDRQRSFLTVTSRSALGNVGQLNYAAAKAGILGMTRTAARELYRYDVRVNSLMPTAYTRMIEMIPESARPFGEDAFPPEKVAPVVAYLLSPAAEGINGCTIRSAGDEVGLVTDPEVRRTAFNEGGWTLEALADRFKETVGHGERLERSEAPRG